MIMGLTMQRISKNYFGKFYRALVILLPLTLSSCGFQAVYKTSSNEAIPPIHINEINSVAGAELYRHLSDLISNLEGSKYQLDIKLVYSSSPLAITKSSDVVQQSASQAVSYRLMNESGEVVLASGFSITGSYNTTSSAYATHVQEEQGSVDLAKKAAEEIHRRLIIYFVTQKTKE